MPILHVSDQGRSREITIPAQGLTIGRETDNDIQLTEARCSRRHCGIERQADGRWLLRDLGSSNGTFLGGRKIDKVLLSDGDIIVIGLTKMRFEDDSPPPPAFTPEVSEQVSAAATIIDEGAGHDAQGGFGPETVEGGLGFTDDSEVLTKPAGFDAAAAGLRSRPDGAREDSGFDFLDEVEAPDTTPAPPSRVSTRRLSAEEAIRLAEAEMGVAETPSRRAKPTSGRANAVSGVSDRAKAAQGGSDRRASAQAPRFNPRFEVVRGPNQGFDLPAPREGSFFVGSNPNNDVCVEHETVAAIHVAVRREGGRFFISASGGANETHLNGKFLVGEKPMEDGAILRLGECALKFLIAGETKAAPAKEDRGGFLGRLRRKKE